MAGAIADGPLLDQPLPSARRACGPCFGRSASLSHVSWRRHLTHLNLPFVVLLELFLDRVTPDVWMGDNDTL